MGIKKKTNTGQGNEFAEKRKAMIDSQIRRRGVNDPQLLAALEKVPRHQFVPPRFRKQAYSDEPLPIGYQQTISQPYIVAYMVEQLQLKETDRVLEIGTGSGYQTAILAELAKQVYSIEIVPELAKQAERILRELGYKNVHLRTGDGHKGWAEAAPFDAIIVSAAPPHIPQALRDQLSLGGRMIIPIGHDQQDLIFLLNTGQRIEEFRKIPVRFVPMTGKSDES